MARLIIGGGGALAAQGRTAPRPPASTRTRPCRTDPAAAGFPPPRLLNLAIGLYFGNHGDLGKLLRHQPRGSRRGAPIIAASGLSGLLSGWLYGRRRHPRPAAPPARHRHRLPGEHGAAASPRAVAIWLGAAVAVHGRGGTATTRPADRPHGKGRPPSVLTQAFTWNNSASAAGLALAAFLAGRAADAWGASAALALAPAAGLVLLVLSLAARRPEGPRACVHPTKTLPRSARPTRLVTRVLTWLDRVAA